MTSDPRPPKTASLADRDQKAEIVDRLYDVALDPIKLEHLLEVWEGRAAPLRQERAIPLEDPEIEAHARHEAPRTLYDKTIGRVTGWFDRATEALADTYQSILRWSLAHKLATTLLTEFDIAWIRLSVNKPGAIRGSRDVGVTIERRNG